MNNNAVGWTKDWPTQEGEYWFYGHTSKHYMSKPRLILVSARLCTNKKITTFTSSQFIDEDDVGNCVWQKAILPELPFME